MTNIQAHRGASKERPENTMAAFRRAEELHADGIEMDVHLLPDGSLAVHHDDQLGRTVNGTGSIYGYTFAQLRELSAGAGFSPAYTLFLILLMHVLLPAALSLGISELLRKIGWVRFGDQKLEL